MRRVLLVLALAVPLTGCATIRRALCDRAGGTLVEAWNPSTNTTRHVCVTGGGAGRGYQAPVEMGGGPEPIDPNPR